MTTKSQFLVCFISGLLVLYFNLPVEFLLYIKFYKLILYQTELDLLLLKLILPLEFIIAFNDTIFLLKFPLKSLLKLWLFLRLLPPTTTPILCLIQLGHQRHSPIITHNSRLLSILTAASQVQAPIIPLLDILIVSHCFPILCVPTIGKFICLLIIAQCFWRCVLIMTFSCLQENISMACSSGP